MKEPVEDPVMTYLVYIPAATCFLIAIHSYLQMMGII